MTISELSNSIANTVESTGASLVRLESRAHRGATGTIWNDQGVLVTANHAVERDENIRATLGDGRTLDAALLGRDPGADLAVLKVDATGLPAATFADLQGVKVGHLAVTLARPGRSVRAVLGIIGALGDEFRTPAGGKFDRYVQTDTAPQHGFSGGLVVDVTGRVLGLNTSGILRDTNVVVPGSNVRHAVDEILAHGQIRRGFLGVGVYPVRLPAALEQQLGQRVGLILVAVEAGSPAEQAGLQLGDVLVTVNGQGITRPGDLTLALEEHVGRALALKVLRVGKVQDVSVTPGERA